MVFAVWVGDLSVLSIWSRAAPSSWVATQTERVGDPNGVIRDPTKNKKIKKQFKSTTNKPKTQQKTYSDSCANRGPLILNLKLTKNTHKKKEKNTQTNHSHRPLTFPSGSRPKFPVGVFPSAVHRRRYPVSVCPSAFSRSRFPVRVLGRDPFRGERAKPLTQTTHKKKREKQSNENNSRQKNEKNTTRKNHSREPLTKKNGKGKPLTKTTHANHSRFRLGRDLGRRPVPSGSRPRVGDHIV